MRLSSALNPRHACTALLALILLASAPLRAGDTPIDRYVAKPDPHYKWEVARTITGEGYTAYIIDLTSQKWRDETEVDYPVWKHWLTVVKPAKVDYTKAMLFIGGGSINKPAPETADGMAVATALGTNSVVASLGQVPNEKLSFLDEKKADGTYRSRNEDSIIAYTWDKYMKTGDETWPLRLPMVKSAVRAMDTVQAFLASEAGGGVKIDGFVVAGASKRGWTTWMTAAVDKRVIAIAPLVIDVLNVVKSMNHHLDAYGFWAPAVGDYVAEGIQERVGTPEHDALMKIEDPYNYRDRFTMPKYMINASGDEFFLPDSSQFYFNDLPGEKYLRYVPNTSHSLAGSDAREGLQAFYLSVLRNQERPKFTWTKEADGRLVVKTQTKPLAVNQWQATNPEGRDFRLQKIKKAYTSVPLLPEADGTTYIGRLDPVPAGWTAFFVELIFDSGGKQPFIFTTEVSVLPDTLPGKEKADAIRKGYEEKRARP